MLLMSKSQKAVSAIQRAPLCGALRLLQLYVISEIVQFYAMLVGMSYDWVQIKAMHLHLLLERCFAVIVIGSMAKLQKAGACAGKLAARLTAIGGAQGRGAKEGALSPGEAARATTPDALLRWPTMNQTKHFTFISVQFVIRPMDASCGVRPVLQHLVAFSFVRSDSLTC